MCPPTIKWKPILKYTLRWPSFGGFAISVKSVDEPPHSLSRIFELFSPRDLRFGKPKPFEKLPGTLIMVDNRDLKNGISDSVTLLKPLRMA